MSNLATKRWRDKQKSKGLCSICVSSAVQGKTMCEIHLSLLSERNVATKKKQVRDGWCRQCGVGTPAIPSHVHCLKCLGKKKRAVRKYKETVIQHYGGACAWPDCHVIDVDMLTLDHVLDDGFKERSSSGNRLSGNAFYLQVIRDEFPEGKYQILCWNHQWKKRIMTLRGERVPMKSMKAGA